MQAREKEVRDYMQKHNVVYDLVHKDHKTKDRETASNQLLEMIRLKDQLIDSLTLFANSQKVYIALLEREIPNVA